MSSLTKEFLDEIGITLDQETYDAFSQHFDTTLYSNVIERILSILSTDQLRQLAELRQSNKDMVWEWLLDNIPDIDLTIQEEIYMLIGDVIEQGDSI